jgi:hypothetical protein
MRIDVHVYVHDGAGELARLASAIQNMEVRMSAQLDALRAQVAANSTVTQSAVTLINGIAQRIIDAGTDPAQLQALADSLSADDAALAQAVAANTVASPAPADATPGTDTTPPATG